MKPSTAALRLPSRRSSTLRAPSRQRMGSAFQDISSSSRALMPSSPCRFFGGSGIQNFRVGG